MCSWWVKAVNRCIASLKLWVEDIQHFIYSHTEVGKNLNCIYQVTVTTLRVTAKHLVGSVSRKVLKKPSSKKTPKTVTTLMWLFFYPNAEKKVLAILRKFSSWQSVQRSRESICQQTSLQIDHFFWSQVEWIPFPKCEEKYKRIVSSMDFHYVFLYEVCWLALIKCFSSENNVKKFLS